MEVKSGVNVALKCKYDDLGRRTKKHINTGDDEVYDEFRHFFYTSNWQVLETRLSESVDTGPETLQPEYQYVWSVRYIDAAVLRDENTDSDDLCDDETLYYLTDANMNVTCLVDTGGDVAERYVYDPYGNVTVYSDDWSTEVATWAASKENPVRYCGYFFDNETGIYHVRNRFYHPNLGRWVSRDPNGYADGLNLYEYVKSRATVLRDPAGLWYTGDHKRLTKDNVLFRVPMMNTPETPSASCLDYMIRTLQKANTGQDWGAASNDNRRHYTRDYVANETDEQRTHNREEADNAYILYVQTEEMTCNVIIGGLPKNCSGCEISCQWSLEVQGKRDHALQDFFMHAIGRDGNWDAWTGGTRPTPDRRGAVWPSSYNKLLGWASGEHPNRGEPVDRDSAEGKARYLAADRYMAKEYRRSLPAWWEKCGCWCNRRE